jgi:conjugal transfer/type IV secretion protein DotA/TraY
MSLLAGAAWFSPWVTGLAQASGMSFGQISQAATQSTDLSRQALVQVFGPIVNDPLAPNSGSGDTILGSIFANTNAALLVIAIGIGGWALIKAVGRIAHNGSVFEPRGSVLFGPIRVLLSLAFLAPTANGWSLAQLLMLWAASIMGVGTANLATQAALTAFENGQSMVAQPVAPSTTDLARNLFVIHLCAEGINAGLNESGESGGYSGANAYITAKSVHNGLGMTFMSNSFSCGRVEIAESTTARSGSGLTGLRFERDLDTSSIQAAHIAGLNDMEAIIDQGAGAFVRAVVNRQDNANILLPIAEVTIQSAAQAYENKVNAMIGEKRGDIAALAAQVQSAVRSEGWWSLGSWYQTFAQANTKLSNAMAATASVTGPSSIGDPGVSYLWAKAMAAYSAQQQSTAAVPAGTNPSADAAQTEQAADANKVITAIFSPGQSLVKRVISWSEGNANAQVNPLIAMKNLGDYTLGLANGVVATYVTAKAALAWSGGFSVPGMLAGFANMATGARTAMEGALDALSPFIVILVLPLFALGVSLSVYLPMVPFLVWFGGVINWLVVVGEAIIAAPLWAMTHMAGEGDGLGHRTGHGYIFLLNVMVRPFLMVVGFFLAGAVVVVGGTFLNKVFGVAMANAQFDSITGVVSIIGFIWLYASTCINLVHRSFNLILIVPDQVINWVGGHASSALGRDVADAGHQSVNILGGQISQRLERMIGQSSGRKPLGKNGNGIKG